MNNNRTSILPFGKSRIGGGTDKPCLRAAFILFLFFLFVFYMGFLAGKQAVLPTDAGAQPVADPDAVLVSKALYHNPDSLLFYAERAYLHDDPKGLYVTAVAAFLREQDPNFPDSCTTVPLDEARIMLQHAADLGYPDAIKSLRCLQRHGQWDSSND